MMYVQKLMYVKKLSFVIRVGRLLRAYLYLYMTYIHTFFNMDASYKLQKQLNSRAVKMDTLLHSYRRKIYIIIMNH